MAEAEEAQRDIIEIVEEVAVQFNLNTVEDETFICLRGQNKYNEPLRDGGFLKDYDMVIVVPLKKIDNGGQLVDRFTEPPTNGDTITIDDLDFEVESVSTDEFDSCLELGLVNANR